MTKQEQIEEMAKIIDEMYWVYTTQADDIAEGLYNAGYRKTFTSDLANDTQKAYKEGYEKAQSELKTEIERLRTTLRQCNTELNSALESLKSQCREIGELKAKVKQTKIDVLNELRNRLVVYYPSVISVIDELIKEYEE